MRTRKRFVQHRAKPLKIDDLGHDFQRIAKIAHPLQPFINVKKANLFHPKKES